MVNQTAKINPQSLSVKEVSQLLSASGKKITPEEIRADVDAGAPVGRDGRINLIQYTAWLVREMQSK